MMNVFNKILFKNRSALEKNRDSEQNPWVKEGEFIYLNSKKGLYKVISVEKDGFSVVKDSWDKKRQPEFHAWNDFKRWSSHTKSSQD